MNLSFQEKSLWCMFVGLIGAFGFYFSTVLPTNATYVMSGDVMSGDVMPEQVVLFVLAVVLLVGVQIVGHIVIALIDRRAAVDERDRLIHLKGTRNASYVLATGIFFALCAAILTEGNFLFIHVLLGFWVLAQLVEIGSQLYLYRKGV